MTLGGFALSSFPQWKHSVHSGVWILGVFSALFALFKNKYGATKGRIHKEVFFLFSKGVQKAQAGPGTASVDCME